MKARILPFLFGIILTNQLFAQTVTKNPGDRPVCVEQDSWFDCKIDRIGSITRF